VITSDGPESSDSLDGRLGRSDDDPRAGGDSLGSPDPESGGPIC
jgi:hypothetical protein